MRRTGGKLHKDDELWIFFLFILVMIVVMCGKEQEILNITHNGCKYK
jgi:hypothetical protein